MTEPLRPYDAVLILSYGGPNKSEDVLPFMRNATRGRGIPDARLMQVSKHYELFGGASPINARNAELLTALRAELSQRGSTVPVVIGNRNWNPFIVDTLRELYDSGARKILLQSTSAYACYSGCRQYREDVAAALTQLEAEGRRDLTVDRARAYFDTDGFVAANALAVRRARLQSGFSESRLVFVTHSIPQAMFEASGPGTPGTDYVAQHRAVCEKVAAANNLTEWDLAFCSRSGAPGSAWLEPDINDHLAELHQSGVTSVVVCPVGFINDHMEVVYDLDTEAVQTAEQLGMKYLRAATVGTDPSFIGALADVLCERAALTRGVKGLPAGLCEGELGTHFPSDCCLPYPGAIPEPAACEFILERHLAGL